MVIRYLEGMLWNLQTYQEGICADYGCNYGKRHSPTAPEISEYICSLLLERKMEGKGLSKTLTPKLLNCNDLLRRMKY